MKEVKLIEAMNNLTKGLEEAKSLLEDAELEYRTTSILLGEDKHPNGDRIKTLSCFPDNMYFSVCTYEGDNIKDIESLESLDEAIEFYNNLKVVT